MTKTREAALERDAADALAPLRELFDLPEGLIYLDGNSLGALPRAAVARAEQVLRDEWGRSLIASWNDHGWIDLPRRVGARIAPLIGAEPGEVVAGDATTINLFKVLSASLRMRPGRTVIVTDRENFPTDSYIAQGLAELVGPERAQLRYAAPGELAAALAPGDVAALLYSHVDYRSARIEDMAGVTRQAQAAGALAIWDLSHSAGAIPVDLNGAGADFAVGCGYKYFNGGPGAPSYLFAASRHHGTMRQPLSGWLGHATPFAFSPDFEPAEGIARMICSTPTVLSMAVLEEALAIFSRVTIGALRAKSLALSETLIARVEAECAGFDLPLASPREAGRRGSHVLFRHPHGYAIIQALKARRVVGDFRAPDGVRLGIAPLYNRHVEMWDAARHLREVLERREWADPAFSARQAVT